MHVALLVGLAICASCTRDKTEPPPAQAPTPPPPLIPTPPPPKQWSAPEIIAAAFAEPHPSELRIEYVDARGLLDLSDGQATLLAMYTKGMRTDARRRIGAPPRWLSELTYSYRITWDVVGSKRGTFDYKLRSTILRRPRCSVQQVWQRAIAGGAPAAALAVIELVAAEAGRPQHWVFAITDLPRDVYFRLEVADDCPPIAEAATP